MIPISELSTLETSITADGIPQAKGINYRMHPADAAARPAVMELAAGKRLLVFAFACPSSGVPVHWAAEQNDPA